MLLKHNSSNVRQDIILFSLASCFNIAIIGLTALFTTRSLLGIGRFNITFKCRLVVTENQIASIHQSTLTLSCD